MSIATSELVLGASDLKVFPLCLGGNVFGWTLDEPASFAILDAYVAAGGNFIDTADVYSAWVPGNAGGESETIIGRWMQTRGNRDQIVLATKVGMSGPLTEEHIRAQIEGSLRRLQTDHVDLYYAHKDDLETPLEVSLAAFDAVVGEGKTRYVAASQYGAARLDEALELSRRERLAEFVALQPLYNLVERDTYEGELQAVCERYGLPCLPFYSLASGFLTGKYAPHEAPTGERAPSVEKYMNDHGWGVLEALRACASARGVPIAAIALAWLASRPMVATPIASATSPAQLASLLAFGDLELTDEEIASLDAASAPSAT
jgi:aryl-alcohol dehydrogenase-like predicted oxidoreductase